jgi:SAM-dependent methyltransferase
MTIPDPQHWNTIYRAKDANEVSWHQSTPAPSLAALDRLNLGTDSAFVDIGGGVSNLVDTLLLRGWTDLTVLDISQTALGVARKRIGDAASRVHWLVADATQWVPERAYDVWHDRAVFHFLISQEGREAYRHAMDQGLRPGGLAIMATFALDGPERCSGLPVQRYDPAELAAEIGPEFNLVDHWREEHATPAGKVQRFTWAVLRRLS